MKSILSISISDDEYDDADDDVADDDASNVNRIMFGVPKLLFGVHAQVS